VAAIAVVNIPVFTRLTRAQGMQIREREYVTASRALGGGVLRIAVKDMLPNLLNALIVQASVTVSFAIVTEASLSFLGLGIQQPTPSWGSMIATAKNYLSTAPHMMFFPAVALCLTVLGLNLFGDALCDALDPQQTGGQ
jgi:ABC-type dipeptide/oligopeptide/nickel transport system permease subunit